MRLMIDTRGSAPLAFLVGIAACLTAGCDARPPIQTAEASVAVDSVPTAAARARQDSVLRATPGYVIDSILPVEEEIRRFQATLGPRPSGLSGGAPSREALVKAFANAVEANDTTALAALVINRVEFGYFLYPSSPNTRPPYRLSPEIVWLTRAAGNNKAAARLLARFGGMPLSIAGFACAGPAETQGDNIVWSDCTVNRATASGEARLRLFGPIVERGGRFKFVSLAGGL